MTVYLLNAPIIPLKPETAVCKILKTQDIELVKEIAKRAHEAGMLVSAVGHQATADLLQDILQVPVPCQRARIFLDEGDIAICFTLKQRLPEGKIITDIEELKQIGYEFTIIEVLPEVINLITDILMIGWVNIVGGEVVRR